MGHVEGQVCARGRQRGGARCSGSSPGSPRRDRHRRHPVRSRRLGGLHGRVRSGADQGQERQRSPERRRAALAHSRVHIVSGRLALPGARPALARVGREDDVDQGRQVGCRVRHPPPGRDRQAGGDLLCHARVDSLAALYRGKQNGRNRIEYWDPKDTPASEYEAAARERELLGENDLPADVVESFSQPPAEAVPEAPQGHRGGQENL